MRPRVHLVEQSISKRTSRTHVLIDGVLYDVHNRGHGATLDESQSQMTDGCLGRISASGLIVRFEPMSLGELNLCPVPGFSNDALTLALAPQVSNDVREILLCRQGDQISFQGAAWTFTIKYDDGEDVQVDSSATGLRKAAPPVQNYSYDHPPPVVPRLLVEESTTVSHRSPPPNSLPKVDFVEDTPTAKRTRNLLRLESRYSPEEASITPATAESLGTLFSTPLVSGTSLGRSENGKPIEIKMSEDENSMHANESAFELQQRPQKRQKLEPSQDSLQSNVNISLQSPLSRLKGKREKTQKQQPVSSDVSQSPEPAIDGFYHGPSPVMVFSNSAVSDKPGLKKFLKAQGGSFVDNPSKKGCNFLCVGKGELKKTAKLLFSMILGIEIVTDEWVTQSSKKNQLLDPRPFIPKDLKDVYGITHTEGDRRTLFKGRVVYLTPALKKDYGSGYAEIERIARMAGADDVVSQPARNFDHGENHIVMGLEHGDLDASKLYNQGVACFSKDFLSASIIRGALELDNHGIQPLGSQSKRANAKRQSS